MLGDGQPCHRVEGILALDAAAHKVGAEIEKGFVSGDYTLPTNTPLQPIPATLGSEYDALPDQIDAAYRYSQGSSAIGNATPLVVTLEIDDEDVVASLTTVWFEQQLALGASCARAPRWWRVEAANALLERHQKYWARDRHSAWQQWWNTMGGRI